MDDIKPVAWAFGQDWSQFQADRQECRLLPNFYWGEDLSISSDYAALYDQQAIDTLRAEVEALRAKTACTMGVGAGDGQLFVHGDYDSIKAAQALVFRAERAEAEAEALRADAERYRAMRDEFTWSMFSDTERTDLTLYMPGVILAAIGPNADDFDAAIDAAKQAAE